MKINPVYTAALVFTLFLTMSGLVSAQSLDWAPPHADAPTGTVNGLLDASTTSQTRQGSLGVDTSPGGTLNLPSSINGLYINSESLYIQQTGTSSAPWSPLGGDAITTNGRIRSNGVTSTSVIQSNVLKTTGTAEKTVCVDKPTGKLKLCGIPLGPTITLTATPPSLAAPGVVNLAWTSNAVSCIGSNFSTGTSKPPNGNKNVTVTVTRIYGVICTDAAGQTASKYITVVVAPADPTATITATPSILNSGQTTVVAWSSTNSTSCVAIPPSPGAFNTGNATSGSSSFILNNSGTSIGTITFAVRCTSSAGTTADATVTVTVNPLLPVVNFSATPVN